jgi:hypothetical protein
MIDQDPYIVAVTRRFRGLVAFFDSSGLCQGTRLLLNDALAAGCDYTVSL